MVVKETARLIDEYFTLQGEIEYNTSLLIDKKFRHVDEDNNEFIITINSVRDVDNIKIYHECEGESVEDVLNANELIELLMKSEEIVLVTAKEMKRLSDGHCEMLKLVEGVLEHAKTRALSGEYKCVSGIHVEEYPQLINSKVGEIEKVFIDLGYKVNIERFKEVRHDYVGNITLDWE